MRPTRVIQVGAVALAAAAAGLPMSPPVVERWFSTRWYPAVQSVLTPLSNLVPFALFDVLIGAAVLFVLVTLARATPRRHGSTRTAVAVTVWRLAVAAATVYLVFLLVWGLNYRRLAMADRVEMSSARPERQAAEALAAEAVRQLNRLHAGAHREAWAGNEWRHAPLTDAFAVTQRILTSTGDARPGRLKWTMLGPFFRWASVDGMVDPFALEALANPDLLPFERPFVAAHEWAHLAGYAHEAEANFVGWLTCVRADAASQYSGWLYLYWELSAESSPRDRASMASGLDEGPRQDLDAIVQRVRRGQFRPIRVASWRVYDQYLRANRVDRGVRSYGEVITLILRARFGPGWTPVRKTHG